MTGKLADKSPESRKMGMSRGDQSMELPGTSKVPGSCISG
jgi:hypothetical protein